MYSVKVTALYLLSVLSSKPTVLKLLQSYLSSFDPFFFWYGDFVAFTPGILAAAAAAAAVCAATVIKPYCLANCFRLSRSFNLNLYFSIWVNLMAENKSLFQEYYMSHSMRFPTMWYVGPAKAQTSLRIRAVWSEPWLVTWIFYEC